MTLSAAPTIQNIAQRLFPNQTLEQDYFDWELAVTGVNDME